MNPHENAPETEASPWIIQVSAQNFEREVLARSKELPVVLDFWAPWCEPCKELGPLLEKHAREGNGRFLLAKIDVDRNPELVQALRVEGVPAVLAIVNGAVANAFQGAVPAEELERFLDTVAPAVARDVPAVEVAAAYVEEGRSAEAITLLTAHIAENTDDLARLLLAELLLEDQKHGEAEAVLAGLSEENAETAKAKALVDRLAFQRGAGDIGELRRAVEQAPEDAAARRALGEALIITQDTAGGLAELLEAVSLDSTGEGLLAKQKMLEVFDILGLEDPLANDYRFKLSMVLFS